MPMESVLLVDDDPGTLDTFRVILRLARYEVQLASTGRDGLSHLQSEDFALALTDLRMPDMSGLELLVEARASGCRTPIVIMTAWGTEALEAASTLLGAKAFVYKPLEPDGLLDVVRQNAKPPSVVRRASSPSGIPLAGYAARRLTRVIVTAVRAGEDVPTVAEWCKQAGVAPATLKAWCAAAGVSASDSLDFARVLRVVKLRVGGTGDWFNDLAIVDPRTMARLLAKAGLSKDEIVPDVGTFLRSQRLITAPALVAAVRALFDFPDL
jgi:CheY-like chemotaxis protein